MNPTDDNYHALGVQLMPPKIPVGQPNLNSQQSSPLLQQTFGAIATELESAHRKRKVMEKEREETSNVKHIEPSEEQSRPNKIYKSIFGNDSEKSGDEGQLTLAEQSEKEQNKQEIVRVLCIGSNKIQLTEPQVNKLETLEYFKGLFTFGKEKDQAEVTLQIDEESQAIAHALILHYLHQQPEQEQPFPMTSFDEGVRIHRVATYFSMSQIAQQAKTYCLKECIKHKGEKEGLKKFAICADLLPHSEEDFILFFEFYTLEEIQFFLTLKKHEINKKVKTVLNFYLNYANHYPLTHYECAYEIGIEEMSHGDAAYYSKFFEDLLRIIPNLRSIKFYPQSMPWIKSGDNGYPSTDNFFAELVQKTSFRDKVLPKLKRLAFDNAWYTDLKLIKNDCPLLEEILVDCYVDNMEKGHPDRLFKKFPKLRLLECVGYKWERNSET